MGGTDSKGKVGAVAKMYSLETAMTAAAVMFSGNDIAIGISSWTRPHVGLGQSMHAFICNIGAFHQTDSLQLGKCG